ncbi:GNAT family N-acetyltransferase [Zavarzinia aquatilis]|uniref:Ribosomal-protein-alanine acetyltransferase n=1 Tax=Zavarzinia aquatilis TaxID=2211142 RepID=A0A317E4B1_9PROT|nr:GNAT family N-acetyltransferase [Zavarzinia aquatilis]PWR20243.1 ribosomal-protein-alanine acetyltransferase [Zavarzinia aquatilis]
MAATGDFPRDADEADLPALAALHGAAFPDDPWDADALRPLAFAPGAIALIVPGGFILLRVAADEAEVITLAVDPGWRRRGIGGRLLAAGLGRATQAGATTAFLEVAIDNIAAIALYREAGFTEVGRRRNYYHRPQASPVDALVLARSLAA